eukprot:Tamp_26633.p1 GENE.Tamp_26633~~Tamp_26633.p1  ORF type:complete len:287 (-),score=8.55 Tamp_26633:26-799(-)
MGFQKVSEKELFVSEPNPAWFGNPANEKKSSWTNDNWLKSRFHFSFAEYNNPKNSNFGVLRVMNDDLVQPARGFGTHPHREMEICTYVVEGSLTHQDSMGTQETLGPGSIQYMTAGTGIQHSEHNRSPDAPLRFIQMWIVPSARGLTPNYGSACGSDIVRTDIWAHMVSDVKSQNKTPVKIFTTVFTTYTHTLTYYIHHTYTKVSDVKSQNKKKYIQYIYIKKMHSHTTHMIHTPRYPTSGRRTKLLSKTTTTTTTI